ncbi:Thiamin-phosphate pyrophosphorylase [hydrothermal vent metagenome]|uniref:thiamine phosphate synthase n=1 Tax=hydrothermal vent metagenome TaxID=652676 RepID=A0A3B1DLZ5_9ZZZZ
MHSSHSENIVTYRILDAAANRAREGLRVLEEYVRFVQDDADLSSQLKNCRHQLATILQAIDLNTLLKSRETLQDVGTSISTATESERASLASVVTANFKRLQEALRTLEEYSKLISPTAAEEISQLRYTTYTLEKAITNSSRNQQVFEGRSLYLLLTAKSCQQEIEFVLQEALAGGVDIVQLREKKMNDGDLLPLARKVCQITKQAGALFIMNDRPDIALLANADGLHIGQEELSVKEARKIVGADSLIGVSTHDIEQAKQAVLDGADYLGVGPTFPSKTKSFDNFSGLPFIQQVANEISLPWFAIGGISEENLSDVINAGASRIAVSHAICRNNKPQQAAKQLKKKLATNSTTQKTK